MNEYWLNIVSKTERQLRLHGSLILKISEKF